VLAVPYPAVAYVIVKRADQLAGKVAVDITNPLNFETFDSLTVPAGASAAAALPQSRVVKAFNTTVAATLASSTSARFRPLSSSRATTRTPRRCWPAATALCAGPVSSKCSASCSSRSPSARRSPGPAVSASSPDRPLPPKQW
jgi:hypothetical protein